MKVYCCTILLLYYCTVNKGGRPEQPNLYSHQISSPSSSATTYIRNTLYTPTSQLLLQSPTPSIPFPNNNATLPTFLTRSNSSSHFSASHFTCLLQPALLAMPTPTPHTQPYQEMAHTHHCHTSHPHMHNTHLPLSWSRHLLTLCVSTSLLPAIYLSAPISSAFLLQEGRIIVVLERITANYACFLLSSYIVLNSSSILISH